jgi:ligand-binding SRPBCC domain-containing protein
MKTIRLTTWIDAPVERCFKLALSVDLHLVSARSTGEKMASGVRSGLLGLEDTVTWSGRHFGLRFRHTSRIVELRPYLYFCDAMIRGTFQHFEHKHHFAPMNEGTRMRDELRFSAPPGLAGVAAELILERHFIHILKERNRLLKQVAESKEWQRYLVAEVKRKPAVPNPTPRDLREKALHRA